MKSPLIRITAVVLSIALMPYLTGCVKSPLVKRGSFVDMADVERPASEDISGISTVDGDTIRFDKGSAEVSNDTIYASVNKEPYTIAFDQVNQLLVSRTNVGLTVLSITAGVVLGVGLFVLLIYALCSTGEGCGAQTN